MTTVLVLYESDYGNTEKMAKAIAEGASSVPNTQVVLKKASAATADDMTGSDAVIMGTPVHMGSMDYRVKTFIDKVCGGLWMQNQMIGKVGGVFASGSGYGSAGGGNELTMLSLLNNLAELGMIIIPLPKNTEGYAHAGLQWGPYGRTAGTNLEQNGLQDDNLTVTRLHGAHIAKAAAAIKGKEIF
jgi:NAD(P)H dehydrogenase (quinone)